MFVNVLRNLKMNFYTRLKKVSPSEDNTEMFIKSNSYPIWAEVYYDGKEYNYVYGNSPSEQVEYLFKKNLLIKLLMVDYPMKFHL